MNNWFATTPGDRRVLVTVNGRPILFIITQNWKIEIQYQPGLVHHVRVGCIGPSFILVWEDGEPIETFRPWAHETAITDDWLCQKILYYICVQMFEDTGPGSENRAEFARMNPVLLRHLSLWMFDDSFGVWPDCGNYPESDRYSYILGVSTNG